MYINKNEYAKEMKTWLYQFEGNYFVTLAFNPSKKLPNNTTKGNYNNWSIDKAVDALKHWHARLDRKLLGPDWGKELKKELRTQFIAFVEHPDSNIHWHLILKLNSPKANMFLEEADAIWEKLVPSGTIDIKPIRTAKDNLDFSGYCSKASRSYDPANHIVFSSNFTM